MKFFFKIFFRTLRIILGPFLLAWNWLTMPKSIERSAEEQAQVDLASQNLTLYQYRTCPFCIKVRRTIKQLALNIETVDAQHDPVHRAALLEGGGQSQVPCLKIIDEQGDTTWLYESSAINQYLQSRFAA